MEQVPPLPWTCAILGGPFFFRACSMARGSTQLQMEVGSQSMHCLWVAPASKLAFHALSEAGRA